MSTSDDSSDSGIGVVEPASSSVPVSSLLEEEGTVPFLGVNDNVDAEYPSEIDSFGERYVTNDSQSFKEALTVLPHAGEGELWASNEFVEPGDSDGTVNVKVDEIRNVHGLDVDKLEERSGLSLDQMVSMENPDTLIPISTHKDIVDRRRLALRTLGFDVRFRWQIASSKYTPGNLHNFFRRKIAACQKHGAENAFGWIRHYDWGGSVTITTIYPSKSYEISQDENPEFDFDNGELTLATESDTDTQNGRDGEDDTITVYYGDRMGYDFRGRQKLWAKPVIYIPSVGAMIPLPYSGTDLSRKHTGDLMGDAIDWHEKILSRIDELTEEINQEITRARLVALDFDQLPFNIQEFYSHLGITNDKYSEKAADQAKRFASPSNKPTLWNLQLSLKIAVLQNYNGNKAGKTYQEYQELAGEILRHPATQITLAKEQHRIESEKNNSGEDLDTGQQTLAESLEEVMDLSGVTENQITASGAQRMENQVQQRLPGTGDN